MVMAAMGGLGWREDPRTGRGQLISLALQACDDQLLVGDHITANAKNVRGACLLVGTRDTIFG